MEGKEIPPSFPTLKAACFLAPVCSGFLPALTGCVLKVPQPFDQGKPAGGLQDEEEASTPMP